MTSNKTNAGDGQGFKQDWDAIEAVNKDLFELKDAVTDRAVGYAAESMCKPERFGKLDKSGAAAKAAQAALEQLQAAMKGAAGYLDGFVETTRAAVSQHKQTDSAAEDEYVNTAKGLS